MFVLGIRTQSYSYVIILVVPQNELLMIHSSILQLSAKEMSDKEEIPDSKTKIGT